MFEVVTAIDDAGVEMGGGAAGGQGLVAEDLAGLGWRVGEGFLGHAGERIAQRGVGGNGNGTWHMTDGGERGRVGVNSRR